MPETKDQNYRVLECVYELQRLMNDSLSTNGFAKKGAVETEPDPEMIRATTSITDLDQRLAQLKVTLLYLVFDREATLRENRWLRQALDETLE